MLKVKFKLLIGKILTSLLFLLLIGNFAFAGFNSLDRSQLDLPTTEYTKSLLFSNDDDVESFDVDFTPEKDGLEENVEPFLGWCIPTHRFQFQFDCLILEEKEIHYFETPAFYQDVPIWIYTRKILL